MRSKVKKNISNLKESSTLAINEKSNEFVEAGKTGDQIKMNEFIELFQFDKTRAAIKNHPEAVVVPAGMALGSAAAGSKGTVMATVGLLKNVGTLTLKTVKLLDKPVTNVVQVEK